MKNRRIKLSAVTAIGFLVLIFSSMNLWAEDEAKPSASADIAVLSQYIWRGFALSRDSIVIQPSTLVIKMLALTFGAIWIRIFTQTPMVKLSLMKQI